jgi:hypothetical protein
METTVQVLDGAGFDAWVTSHGGKPGATTAAEASHG